jgi:hypothetical protein
MRHYRLAGRSDWRHGAEMKNVTIDLHSPGLRLASPVWKERNEHGVRKRPLLFIDMERARVRNVRCCFVLVIFYRAVEPIPGCEIRSIRF